MIELSDLAALFVELAGEAVPADWDARSFSAVLRGQSQVHRPFALAMQLHRHWRSITDGRWKLVLDSAGPQLFDLHVDPWESVNLAATQEGQVKRLSAALKAELNIGGLG